MRETLDTEKLGCDTLSEALTKMLGLQSSKDGQHLP